MAEFKNTHVHGIEVAMMAQRNPMNSWHLADSDSLAIGERDLDLAQRLLKGGDEHAKAMRFINVTVDVTAPRYWFAELDTYKFVDQISTSTMHKLFDKTREISLDDFVYNEHNKDFIELTIGVLNDMREKYSNGGDKLEILKTAKMILPEGYLNKRTIRLNYQCIRNMYKQRKSHRLTEWNTDFVKWVETLPYSKELITYGL